jgi:hypothetical protein
MLIMFSLALFHDRCGVDLTDTMLFDKEADAIAGVGYGVLLRLLDCLA